MKQILFVDPVCPSPYNYGTLRTGALGGTEATVIRITNALHGRYNVWLEQRGRTGHDTTNIHYIGQDQVIQGLDPAVVVTLRDAGVYNKQRAKYPNAQHYLWLHDVVTRDYLGHMVAHLKDQPRSEFICVSNWHKSHTSQVLAPYGVNPKIGVIFPPLAEYCVKTSNEYDPYKLIFCSSPHKGLDHTLEVFKVLRAKDSRYILYITNPGYFKDKQNLPEGVVSLGTLTHEEAINSVRGSLCLFYPNTSFSETFGLVMAEANALGVPVIAHSIGAAPEVVFHFKEIMDCNNIEAVVERVLRWSSGERLIVKGKPEYTLGEVVKTWVRLLE